MSSLDRLIDLAKRTGDRLIVHDPIHGRDMVIMDVDEYERMVMPKKDVRELTSKQMLDQINRDIAVWRANKELEAQFDREENLVKEAEAMGPFDPFAETDFHAPEWHSAGSVLSERNKELGVRNNGFDDLGIDENEIEIPDFGELVDFDLPEETSTKNKVDLNEETKIEDLPFDLEEEIKTTPVPFTEHHDDYLSDGGGLKEEKLPDEDEPVFYEEPV